MGRSHGMVAVGGGEEGGVAAVGFVAIDGEDVVGSVAFLFKQPAHLLGTVTVGRCEAAIEAPTAIDRACGAQ